MGRHGLNNGFSVEEGFFLTVEGVVDTRTVFATLVLSILYLGPGLSKKRVATSNFMSDPMRFDKHPCLFSEGLLSKTCKLELCEILELPKSSRSGFPQGCQFF